MPAMLIGTIYLYHFVPLSLSLTLPGGHKVSLKQNLLASFLLHFAADQDEIRYGVEVIQVEHPNTNFEQDSMKQGK